MFLGIPINLLAFVNGFSNARSVLEVVDKDFFPSCYD